MLSPVRPPVPERRLTMLLAAGMLAAALVALHVWRDLDYWNYSEGVYALTSRLLLDGNDLYGDVVVAQPPVMFLAGGALLAVDDSITWLRLGMGAVQALTAALAAVAVWRLTGKALAAALAAPLAMLTPWAAHEHGLLTPELVGAPLLVGGALLAARPGRAPAAALRALTRRVHEAALCGPRPARGTMRGRPSALPRMARGSDRRPARPVERDLRSLDVGRRGARTAGHRAAHG